MDTSILLTTSALLSSAAAVIMFVVWFTRKTSPGFVFWAFGIALLALGAALLVPNALPQTWYLRVARNALLVGGALLILRGMLRFRDYQVGYWLEAAVALVFFTVFGYYSTDPNALNERIVIYCVFAAGLSIGTVLVTLRQRPRHFGSNDVLLALWMSVYALMSLLRIVHQLTGEGAAFEALQGFGAYYAMAQILTVQLVTLTLVSMNSQRIEHEYRASEQRLSASESQLRTIGDNLPDGFVYQFENSHGQQRFNYVSAGVQRMLGVTPAEMMKDANALFGLLDPASKAQYGLAEALSARELTVYSGSLLFRLSNGEQVWLQVRSNPKRLRGGGTVWDGVALDVTQRKLAEAELEKYRSHLESVVEERTAALTEAKQVAEAANRAKDAFLANMSHELRTPLNSIIGFTHLLLKTQLSPFQAKRLRDVQASGKHLLSVISDILDFSKIESGRVELERVPFQLDAVLDHLAALFGDSATHKGLEFLLTVDDGVPHAVLGDPLRIQQVLINYVNNAIKFTNNGEVTVRISLEHADQTGVQLRFSVSDTGIGIEPASQARLFQSFQQADTSTTRRFGGTGLGLAISKRLVELMGGQVGFQSALGQGSTFWFSIRLDLSTEVQGMAPSPLFEGLRVLVVDDNPAARQVLANLLKRMACNVTEADSGDAALSVLKDAQANGNPFKIALLDWLMPQCDGIETAERMKALGLSDAPQCILVTGAESDELASQAKAAGCVDLLVKPVVASHLVHAILAALQQTARETEPLPNGNALWFDDGRFDGDEDGPLFDEGSIADLLTPPIQPESAVSHGTADATDWFQLRQQLLSLLQDDDASSTLLFESHEEFLKARLGPAFDGIKRAIQAYDFEMALSLLKKPATTYTGT